MINEIVYLETGKFPTCCMVYASDLRFKGYVKKSNDGHVLVFESFCPDGFYGVKLLAEVFSVTAIVPVL